jgi:hypothetical protein
MSYVDNRNWPEYNAQLVRRGEFYLDLNCVKNWSWELREMNRKKTGAPYKYPDSFMTFASIIYSFCRMPYRQLEGFIGKLSTYEPGLVAADYTTLIPAMCNAPLFNPCLAARASRTALSITSAGAILPVQISRALAP